MIGPKAGATEQERWQIKHLVAPGLSGCTRYRPARFRRYVDEFRARACRGAFGQVQAETQFIKKHEFEPHHKFPGRERIIKMLYDQPKRLKKPFMRIPFGKQAQMRGQRLQAVDRAGAIEEPGGVEFKRLRLEGAQMLIEPGPPQQVNPVANLKNRLLLA